MYGIERIFPVPNENLRKSYLLLDLSMANWLDVEPEMLVSMLLTTESESER